jgi:hypothetical protein
LQITFRLCAFFTSQVSHSFFYSCALFFVATSSANLFKSSSQASKCVFKLKLSHVIMRISIGSSSSFNYLMLAALLLPLFVCKHKGKTALGVATVLGVSSLIYGGVAYKKGWPPFSVDATTPTGKYTTPPRRFITLFSCLLTSLFPRQPWTTCQARPQSRARA